MIRVPIAKPLTGEEEAAAAGEVIRSGMLAAGEQVRRFEEEFAAYCGTGHAVATSNGTTALHAALLAANVGEGDSVIVPAFTFFATASAVSMTGARPKFVDVEMDTFNISPDAVGEAVDRHTKAIIGVHLFGQPFDVKGIRDLCEDHGIVLIEDAAQAHGAVYQGRRVGGLGAMACFSFYPTKNMTTGEGGMVTTDDRAYAERIRMIINHGQKEKYLHAILGYNYRMTDIAGAIGRVQLRKLDRFNELRNRNAAMLNTLLRGSGLMTPHLRRGVHHVYHQYVVRVTGAFPLAREALVAHLTERGIGTAIHYPVPLPEQPCYAGEAHAPCPRSAQLAREVLSLPVHPALGEEEMEAIAHAIGEVS
ncbi:MAG: DegT/DnrJ/EryC1/StrS family aminotransferase [Methanomicrobiales archaeon]|nr:DegT/DnrJ/EryC1/StrS family aminotransferase [Methanomicrobiales archaeon]